MSPEWPGSPVEQRSSRCIVAIPGSQRCARWSNQYQAARHSRKSAARPAAQPSRNEAVSLETKQKHSRLRAMAPAGPAQLRHSQPGQVSLCPHCHFLPGWNPAQPSRRASSRTQSHSAATWRSLAGRWAATSNSCAISCARQLSLTTAATDTSTPSRPINSRFCVAADPLIRSKHRKQPNATPPTFPPLAKGGPGGVGRKRYRSQPATRHPPRTTQYPPPTHWTGDRIGCKILNTRHVGRALTQDRRYDAVAER